MLARAAESRCTRSAAGPAISKAPLNGTRIFRSEDRRQQDRGYVGARQRLGRRFAAALLPRLFGKNPRSHHKPGTRAQP